MTSVPKLSSLKPEIQDPGRQEHGQGEKLEARAHNYFATLLRRRAAV